MRDEDILEQLRTRADTAVQSLTAQYGHYCHTVAYRILQNDEDTAECLNDVYLKVWNAAETADIHELKPYLATVTRNTAVDLYHKRKAHEHAIAAELAECGGAQDEAATVTDSIVIKQTLDAFLETLGKTERWVFMRRYWNMDSIKDIAAACGKRDDAVRVMLSRTRKKLKTRLEKEGIVL